MAADLSAVNVLAELERLGWESEPSGDDEVRCRCPAHADRVASCSINVEKRVWKCHAAGCGASGDIATFVALALKIDRKTVLVDLVERYKLAGDEHSVDAAAIEKWHQAIWRSTVLLRELRKRGISDETIRAHRIGVSGSRITIPIPNERGVVVNVRKYLPGAPATEKMRSLRGRGKICLYPIEQLKYSKIVLCGGEMKALVAAQHLNDAGIGAITATAGEGNWSISLSKQLAGKTVYVCYDIDAAGRAGARRVANQIAPHAARVSVVDLPLDEKQYPHGDLNDFFGRASKTAADLLSLLGEAQEWQVTDDSAEVDQPGDSELLTLSDSTKAQHAGRRIRVNGLVTALDTTPYLVPRKVLCCCERDQPFCAQCPVNAETINADRGGVELTLNSESPVILEMVNANRANQPDAIRRGLRIPPCKAVTFKVQSHYNVEDLRVSPQLEIGTSGSEHVLLPAYSVSHGLEMNVGYQFEGRTYPHPKTQQAVFLVAKAEPTNDTLANYAPSSSELEELVAFRPEKWSEESLAKKLSEVYEDLEANVTRIFKRRDLHLVIDLAYHSVLVFQFDGRQVKGWVEVLVVGDSAQGKTETSKCLMDHYGLGERVECKNASVAGLLGGVQQLGNRWFVTWGIIPTHDRRLVVLEELKGASVEIISRLTDMRSSGIAEIPKIEKRRTHARTRLIALSNPRSNRPMSAYNYGIDAIRELIGNPEDIRRFDAALVVSSQQIDAGELNTLAHSRPAISHSFTGALCRRCVLWAWTRGPHQVQFDEGVQDAILRRATELSEKFIDAVPLVDRGSMRLKLARLSVALAARTFSSTSDMQSVFVRDCHVEHVAKFLDETYSSKTFGYADYSEAYTSTRALTDRDGVRRKVLASPFPGDFIDQILHSSTIELRDLCDWTGWDTGAARELLSFFVRKHALHRSGNAYRKTPEFIELLKGVKSSGDLKIVDRPSHVTEPEKEDF